MSNIERRLRALETEVDNLKRRDVPEIHFWENLQPTGLVGHTSNSFPEAYISTTWSLNTVLVPLHLPGRIHVRDVSVFSKLYAVESSDTRYALALYKASSNKSSTAAQSCKFRATLIRRLGIVKETSDTATRHTLTLAQDAHLNPADGHHFLGVQAYVPSSDNNLCFLAPLLQVATSLDVAVYAGPKADVVGQFPKEVSVIRGNARSIWVCLRSREGARIYGIPGSG